MVVLAGQLVPLGVSVALQANSISKSEVSSSQGVLVTQQLLKALATLSIGLNNLNQASLTTGYYKLSSLGFYQDYFSSFARVFGVNARQDGSKIYLSKFDLSQLTAHSTNSAQSIFVALLLQVLVNDSNSLLSAFAIQFWKAQLIKVDNQPRILTTLLVDFYIPAILNARSEIVNANQLIIPSDYNT